MSKRACDIVGCHKHAIHVVEDMSDGEYLEVCGAHYRKMMLAGGYR